MSGWDGMLAGGTVVYPNYQKIRQFRPKNKETPKHTLNPIQYCFSGSLQGSPRPPKDVPEAVLLFYQSAVFMGRSSRTIKVHSMSSSLMVSLMLLITS